MSKSAIILGASGLTGSLVLNNLLEDERYSSIKLFSRKSSSIEHPKLEEYIIDLLKLSEQQESFTADEVYCCIGTTKKKTPNQGDYHKIDFGIPVAAAKLAKANGIETFQVISAMGANVKSSIFYNRTKGEMEAAVLEEKITHTYILRPALITGNRKEKRAGEKISIAIFSVVNLLLIGGLKKYSSIKAEDIAKAMIQLANEKPDLHIIDSGKIKEIADSNVK